MIDTVLFDLDGTLLNTIDDLADSMNYVLEKNGYTLHTVEEIKGFVGNGINKLVERSLPFDVDESVLKDCIIQFKAYYNGHNSVKTRAYDGITALLKELNRKGIKIGIVSNKTDEAVKQLCREYFDGLYAVAIGDSEGVRKKPYPDTAFKALEQLSSDIYHAIYVGDSDVDVLTAKNAGIKCISVLWGFRDRALLTEKGAEHFVSTPDEILNYLD